MGFSTTTPLSQKFIYAIVLQKIKETVPTVLKYVYYNSITSVWKNFCNTTGQSIPTVPPHIEEDDVCLKMTPLK